MEVLRPGTMYNIVDYSIFFIRSEPIPYHISRENRVFRE